MIIEGIVTTTDPGGGVNVAPMGPLVGDGFKTLQLRPFKTSRTYQNLKLHPEGVFHITDDVELIAAAVSGEVSPPLRPAESIRGWILRDACRYYEFRIENFDDRAERTSLAARVVASGTQREFLGFNRAKHAVVEAAILFSRIGILPDGQIRSEMERLQVIVEKTGGEAERRAFRLLQDRVPAPSAGGASIPEAVEVRTGSRLHFGLLAPWPAAGRRFGGAGMMVEAPGIDLRAERAGSVSAEGPLADRALPLFRSILERLAPDAALPELARGARISIRSASPEHAGLGTGTQLGMACARAAAALLGKPHLGGVDLASLAGRGARSAIGVHGFTLGGLLIDGGRAVPDGEGAPVPEKPAPLISRLEVPESWSILLVLPAGRQGISGSRESLAFRRLEEMEAGEGRQAACGDLCRSLLLALLPAAAEADFQAFSRALWEFGCKAGDLFAAVQGGRFAGERTGEIVDAIRREGIEGAGQSSWGPAVYAFCEDSGRASRLAEKLSSRLGLLPGEMSITRPLNRGAGLILG